MTANQLFSLIGKSCGFPIKENIMRSCARGTKAVLPEYLITKVD